VRHNVTSFHHEHCLEKKRGVRLGKTLTVCVLQHIRNAQ
jgi:hypothetical protein